MKLDKKLKDGKFRKKKIMKKATPAEPAADDTKKIENVDKKPESSVKLINKIVFDLITKLTNENKNVRVQSGLQLLQHLNKNGPEKEKEQEYVLKRLIRGLGASTKNSRAGFFTTLKEFLVFFVHDSFASTSHILQIAEDQLKVKGVITNKEDADAITGKILVCGALIKSNIKISIKETVKIIEMLLSSSKHRQYHHNMSFLFISELLMTVSEEQFGSLILSILEPEILRPWPKQTVQSLNCFMVCQDKFSNIINTKYLKAKTGFGQIFHSQSFESIFKLFWENTNISVVIQPGIDRFSHHLCKSKNFKEFWKYVDSRLATNSSKISEIVTLKVITDVVKCNQFSLKEIFNTFFSETFIKILATTLKSLKVKKDDIVKVFYTDFFESLIECCKNCKEDDIVKVEIIQKLIFYPGQIDIDKLTSVNVIRQIIQNLNQNSIKHLFKIYKTIFLNKAMKNPEDPSLKWLNFERQNAGYMLQYLINLKPMQFEFDWRAEELNFFMTSGLFYLDEDLQISKESSDFIKNDFAEQMKNIFYSCIQTKTIKLKEEKKILKNLVEKCNEILQKKHFNKYFRNEVDIKIIKSWNEMYSEVQNNSHDKLQKVFQILLLHMGLQLFREPQMAESAIVDLEKCMQKIKERKIVTEETNTSEEPNWVEVVVDLFLHLLSQNNSALRNVVNGVFPHLCDSLTLTAVHQILSVLEMKDGYNPLSTENDIKDEDEGANNDTDEDEKDDDEEEEGEEEGDGDDSDSEVDEDEDIMEEEEEDDITKADQLRSALSQALRARDSDQESIDLDDMDEEEGERLDEALAEAFKAMKKSSSSNDKRSKGYRVQTTTVMHFRIRVLELIEIYLQNKPSLLITLEILSNLFNMVEYCIDEELQPLASKVEKTLNKLAQLRQFESTNDVNEQNICNYLRLIVEKKLRSTSFEAHNRVRSKCCEFLIFAAKLCCDSKELDEVTSVFIEYLKDFIQSRNPICNITLLGTIFKIRSWNSIFKMAVYLAENGLQETIRTYRRIQILELLEIFYRNHPLIQENLSHKSTNKALKHIEKSLENHVDFLCTLSSISQREFNKFLELIAVVHHLHKNLKLDYKFNVEHLSAKVQELRQRIKLENRQSYLRFCMIFKLKILPNSELKQQQSQTIENGGENHLVSDNENGQHDPAVVQNIKKTNVDSSGKNKLSKKNKILLTDETSERQIERKKKIDVDFMKEKKLKKEQRLKLSSEGLNGGFSFTCGSIEISDNDDVEQSYENQVEKEIKENKIKGKRKLNGMEAVLKKKKLKI